MPFSAATTPPSTIRDLMRRAARRASLLGVLPLQCSPKTVSLAFHQGRPSQTASNAHQTSVSAVSADGSRSKYYVLSMFPYPSGRLHMGHFRIYAIADTIARFRYCTGNDLIHPMGWDAFGLPAENAALDHDLHPATWTRTNIDHMRQQLKDMGTCFEWKREISTIDPSYYKWTQLIFLKLLKSGLAYQKEAWVNWDPVDETVLANEQVDAQGRADRSGALVQRRKLRQWFLKTNHYAEELLNDLNDLDWPDHVKQLQRNWIGKTEGWEVDFRVCVASAPAAAPSPHLTVFVENLNHLLKTDYLAISPEHLLVSDWYLPKSISSKILKYAETAQSKWKTTRSNANGVFAGIFGSHPVTGKRIPIYISDALMSPASITKAAIGVPNHSPDHARFAMRHKMRPMAVDDLTMNATEIGKTLTDTGLGRQTVRYRLRDWLVSRQRYWGTPIPVIHCATCGVVPIEEPELPIVLPEDLAISGRGVSSLNQEWSKCTCPKCKQPATRETDTMDTFVDSSWYWLRYLDPHNSQLPCDNSLASKYLPVDLYIGGVEHAAMHLLYARFMGKFLRDQGMLGDALQMKKGEPFKRLLAQGMVQNQTYRCPKTGRYFKKEELDLSDPRNVRIKSTNTQPVVTYEKMSKSKYNGVDPEDIIREHGADAARLHILYRAAPADELLWDDNGAIGMSRWLNRVRELVLSHHDNPALLEGIAEGEKNDEARTISIMTLSVIEKVTTSLSDTYAFHTAIASLIKFTNALVALSKESQVHGLQAYDTAVRTLVQLMTPFAPGLGSELRDLLKIESVGWPTASAVEDSVDGEIDVDEKTTVVIMVNGKARGTFQVSSASLSQSDLIQDLARRTDTFKKWVDPAPVKRVLIVDNGKVINFLH
ncbi:leucine---tRNA ligase [Synchytrium endobioticum]|uniref:leucine--tRNA ligase n=1 Tax=Synchytrium endobioticum TaxID=286115 RepID=A0A507C1J9_9FUNG|nr:leucine---tRNA ligase [Synchytrium endobioticum]TPX41280.1 leucine---tRNA ligase [Synchytrium endobioticum]